MEKITFDDWDPAEEIEDKEDIIAYLEAALDENDPDFLLRTTGHIARSKGMARLVRELGLDHEEPYKSFPGEGEPPFRTVIKALDHLGFKVEIRPKEDPAPPFASQPHPAELVPV